MWVKVNKQKLDEEEEPQEGQTKKEEAPEMSKNSRFCCCVICSLFWLIVVAFGILVIGIAAVIGTLKAPKLTLKDVSMSKFSLDTSNNVFKPSATFSMAVKLSVECDNPNRISMAFDHSFFNVTWQGMTLGSFDIQAFKQPSQRKTVITTQFTVENYDPLKLGYNVLKDFVKGNPITLTFDGALKASLKLLYFYTPKFKAKLHCDYTFNSFNRDVLSHECKKSGGF